VAELVEASAPSRVDLAGGTLDLWPLHVLHPGSVTVNLAIDRFARCRVAPGKNGFRVSLKDRGSDDRSGTAEELLAVPETALVGSLILALQVSEPLEIEIASEVPFGSGLGGSSALLVALMGALERFSPRGLAGVDRVDFVRDVETRVLRKPAGVQDYFPPLSGGLHRIVFEPGRTRAMRVDVDADLWERHLTLFDTGASHSSGMNNWEIFRARLEDDEAVAARLEGVRRAAVRMAAAAQALDFPAMGEALAQEWDARRELAPVVSTPVIERAVAAARAAGAWGGKACGAGGGGCVVFLSPPNRTTSVRDALGQLGEGALLPVRAVNRGLEVSQATAR
jgi:D-glycero-alpha-D-manno-heptose-7-phosphate kinase